MSEMDSNCPATSTRSFSCDDHERSDREYINYCTSLPRNPHSDEKDSRSNVYSSEKEVIIKRGRPREYWPDSRQNMNHHQTCYEPKHDGQIPSLALVTKPRNDHCQDRSEKSLVQTNNYFSKLKPDVERHEVARKRIERSPRKQVSIRGVDITLTEPRHSLCNKNKSCYPTRTQIRSAFTPARGQCYKPCCHDNIQKYNEPCFLPCYPLVIPEEQDASPRLDRDICYHNLAQLSNYSLAKQSHMKSSPKNPIIIDCFSLAVNANNAEEIPAAGVNQDSTVAGHLYEEEQQKGTNNEDLHPKKYQHDCIICQQIATGEVIPQLCNTSVIRNKCCYQTNNSCYTVSSTGHMNDESPRSCWDNTPKGEVREEKKPRSPEHVALKQEYEEPDSQEAVEERRLVINSAFSTPRGKKPKNKVYESSLQVLPRQETRISDEPEIHVTDKQAELLPNSSNELPCHPPTHHYTSTNTAPLHSPDNTSADDRNSLQRKWEAMYDILEDPDKASKKSYFCSHCGRGFTHLSSLNNHIRTHTGQKPFRCRYCGKRFAQSGVLTAHLRTHTGEKPFKCVLCGKRFAQTTTLANHIRTHTGQKPFSCRYCKRTFAQSSTRNKHELSHTKEKPFECKYCGRSFTQSATVMRHMRIHMRDTKYSCVHCGKTFAYLYSLDRHLDEHTG